MSGILYVVATPIGNLEDITLRALRILRDVSLIAAEDTRRTARLLQHYSISTRTTSLHEHNERNRTPALIARLQRGESIALVSDAGTPLISDPGRFLVESARNAGIRVEAIPGPSAVMTALSMSGFEACEFVFLGFPPSRSGAREKWLGRLKGETRLAVFFEAPHRIRATIEALGRVIGLDRTIAVGRELTKKHENMVIQPISTVFSSLSNPMGEYTVLIPPIGLVTQPIMSVPDRVIGDEFGDMTNLSAIKPRDAMKMLAERYGLSVNDVYRAVMRARGSGE